MSNLSEKGYMPVQTPFDEPDPQVIKEEKEEKEEK
jgi:hypothetical protein